MKTTTIKKRKTLLFLLLLFICSSINAQQLIGKLYKTIVPVLVTKSYPPSSAKNSPRWADAADRADSVCEAKSGYIFQIIDIKNDTIIIRWWAFTEASAARQKSNNSLTKRDGMELISYNNTDLDYKISLADLNAKCIPYYGNSNQFIWGAVTMPIKLRFGNRGNRYFSFQESLNIGVAAGWSWQREGVHEKSRNLLFSVGVSNVALDSLDFKKEEQAKSWVPNVKTTAAVTVAAGYVFQYENFQVGAFTGFDMLPYEFGRRWLNKGKPWFGVGLGVSLFHRNQQQAGTGKNVDKDLPENKKVSAVKE